MDTGLELSLTFTKSSTIGPEGGFFGIDASRLIVPQGAVSNETLFTLDLTFGQYIVVELAVASVADGLDLTEFGVPVTVE
ncbi:MAG: hypothetical protein GWN71_33735, partial [Gammaproteobacteria bacterium]|nr:hypothetical protein [Gemmatimonadota bacterium]NIU78341.1 hypothetical protein [Gammaproteobacteria bacterium]